MPDDEGPRPGLLGLSRDAVRSARGHDLVLYAAGTTAFAVVGLVPLLLLSLRLTAALTGGAWLRDRAAALVVRVPEGLGARDAADWLVREGAVLDGRSVLSCLVPAMLYGEGLVRALDRLDVEGEAGRRVLRGRLGAVALLALSPVLVLSLVGAAHVLPDLLPGGLPGRLLGTYLSFLVGWLVVGAVLVPAYAALTHRSPGLPAVLWGGLGTASVVAGFGLGWVLFLVLDLPVERAYGGASALGALAATVLWLLLLHVLVLVGYVVTLRIDARAGRPTGAVVRRSGVRSGAARAQPDDGSPAPS